MGDIYDVNRVNDRMLSRRDIREKTAVIDAVATAKSMSDQRHGKLRVAKETRMKINLLSGVIQVIWTMRFAFSLLLALLANTAQAACPGQSQLEMNNCAAARYEQADAQLNAAWPPAKSYMDGLGAGELLLDAQRKWLAFRDATCSAEIAPFAGGSIQPLIWYDCLARVTLTRTYELQALTRP